MRMDDLVPTTDIVSQFGAYGGILGLIIAVQFLVQFYDKWIHAKERAEWYKITAATNQALRELTTAIQMWRR